MSRAQQFEIFAAGAMYNGAPVVDGYVRFYEAGTTTLKNAWEDADKSAACTTKQLDTQGRAEVYGDGIYKLRIYAGNPDTTGVLRAEIDFYKCTALVGNRRTVTGNTTVTRDDEVILANTAAGNITLTLDDVATFDRSVVIKKIHAANSLIIVTTASQLIDALTDLTFTRDGESVELVPDYDGDLWRRSNELAGLTGLTATAEEINAAAEFVDGLPANSAAEHEYLAQVIDLSSGTSDFTTENAAFIVKVGNMVSFSWETNAHANAATASSASGIIPAAYRPAVTAYSARFSVVANNGTSNVAVGSTGSVTVGHRDLAGEAQNNTQILPGSMTWYVASS